MLSLFWVFFSLKTILHSIPEETTLIPVLRSVLTRTFGIVSHKLIQFSNLINKIQVTDVELNSFKSSGQTEFMEIIRIRVQILVQC